MVVISMLANPAHAEGPTPPESARAPVQRLLAPLRVEVEKSKVDLKSHCLEVRVSREARRVTLKVQGESGATLAEVEQDGSGVPAGAPLVVSWTPASDEAVARIELFAYDVFGYYAGVALTPWSLSIPHEELTFHTNSARIEDSEKPKLEASLMRIAEVISLHRELGTVTLFIAGHTDTVGNESNNLRLSLQRARAIASWFLQRDLAVPIAYEGFGESALLVKTIDEIDEPRNRRVDYILALGEPNMATTGFRATWKRVR
jgi:outer membrane protein OmpA-like peptidoglycan-associated protein